MDQGENKWTVRDISYSGYANKYRYHSNVVVENKPNSTGGIAGTLAGDSNMRGHEVAYDYETRRLHADVVGGVWQRIASP